MTDDESCFRGNICYADLDLWKISCGLELIAWLTTCKNRKGACFECLDLRKSSFWVSESARLLTVFVANFEKYLHVSCFRALT